MAATIVESTKLKLHLDDGKTTTITLPKASVVTDSESGVTYGDPRDAFAAIAAAFASDDGATVASMDYATLKSESETIVSDIKGNA